LLIGRGGKGTGWEEKSIPLLNLVYGPTQELLILSTAIVNAVDRLSLWRRSSLSLPHSGETDHFRKPCFLKWAYAPGVSLHWRGSFNDAFILLENFIALFSERTIDICRTVQTNSMEFLNDTLYDNSRDWMLQWYVGLKTTLRPLSLMLCTKLKCLLILTSLPLARETVLVDSIKSIESAGMVSLARGYIQRCLLMDLYNELNADFRTTVRYVLL